MPDVDAQTTPPHPPGPEERPDRGRRDFLLLVPTAVCAVVTATLAAAAVRFLRPHVAEAEAGEVAGSRWTALAPVSEFTGDQPSMRTVSIERPAGWTIAREERIVYVLPQQNNRVVSAVCPHEGCEVVWREEERDFFCPCHDSRFSADGARAGGPAERGLFELPARVENGVLEVQYPALVTEPPVRG